MSDYDAFLASEPHPRAIFKRRSALATAWLLAREGNDRERSLGNEVRGARPGDRRRVRGVARCWPRLGERRAVTKRRPIKLRCSDCNLRRTATPRQADMVSPTAPFVCRPCRERAVARGHVDPAQAPLPFEGEAS